LYGRLVAVWTFLVVATLISVFLFETFRFSNAIHSVGLVVIAVAFAKVRFIVLDFMELRHAPRGMRLSVEAWVAILGTTLGVLYWFQSV
jgi:hypothetical protein